RLTATCLAFLQLLVVCPIRISSRSYSNGLIFYELNSHTPYLPPTVSVSRGRNLASVKYSEKGSIWSTFGQPCECSGPMCSCCAGLKVDQYGFDQKVCANVSFVPQLEEARLEVFLNDRPSSKYGISVRNPAPFCIPVMMGVPMAMCVQMTDVAVVGSNLNMCMDFVVRMATTDLFEMHFQCMRMGTDGLQYVDKNGKPVLPQGQQQGDDPEEYEYAELEDQPEYTSQEEDYPRPEENPPAEELQADLGYPQPQNSAQIVEQLKNNTEQINDQLKVADQQVGYQPLVPLVIDALKEVLPLDTQKLVDQRPQEEAEDLEPLPIESEMLMAGDQSEDSATEDTEEATEEATEDGKDTEAHTEKEKEVETGTEAEAEEEEAPDNDHDNGNDNDNASESGPRPQVIETITNSIKATEAPTTTTTAATAPTATPTTTTTTTVTPSTTKTTKIIPIANIAGIDYTNNEAKTETEEELQEEKVKKSSEAADEGEEGEETESESESELESEPQPEAEAVSEAEDEGGETTTLAIEMENDSDNEINVDDDNDDYDEDQRQVKEPPKQQDDNEQEDNDDNNDDDDDDDEEEAEDDVEEPEHQGEGEVAKETEE
ncbi:hypothetical protein KR032_009705, partial [Drosophila birchii]